MSSDLNKQLMFWGNLGTAVAYFVIAGQLVLFVNSPQVLSIFPVNERNKDGKIRHTYRLMMAAATLFSSFICMCGNTHLMNVIHHMHPRSQEVVIIQSIIMLGCAFISIVTAVIGFRLFPAVAEVFQKFELGNDGSIQHAENYLVEVVEMLKESILVLTEDLVVVRCNDITRVLFGGASLVNTQICDYIKTSDLPMFKETTQRVMNCYDFAPVTTEVRIRRSSPNNSTHEAQPDVKQKKIKKPDASNDDTTDASSEDDEEFLWIEVTMCKGKQINNAGGFDYDLKMVCRDIDDHKKRQAFQTIIEGTEERDRINESKLRYISCIAHDLKTPLQSFSFSLDLLDHTGLHPEQREFVQQANVAVDLMKLTISQTMDISKALTGAKLMPRRTTVYLSSVLNRVKIIINGYGKQVPVSFEVAPDVCDEIITDEEWLWQMLLNLLTNACKYTDRGSISVRLSVTTVTSGSTEPRMSRFSFANVQNLAVLDIPQESPYMLLCEVLDTGIGISPDKIGHIFDAFAQVQEGQVTGTGLGLFGVRTRAEGLLGTCGARHNTESSTGTGTVLWFSLPYVPNLSSSSSESPMHKHVAAEVLRSLQATCAPTPINGEKSAKTGRVTYDPAASPVRHNSMEMTVNVSSPGVRAAANARSPLMRATTAGLNQASAEMLIRALNLTAMVVEDTPTVRKLMEKLLLSMGFASVKCYENGSKGLEAMMAAPVDIVFSDVQMPIMTGPEMARRFRMWEANVALYVQSGDSPSRSMAANASHSDSCVSADDPHETRSALHAVSHSPAGVSLSPSEHALRKRQLIVAVTANSAECETANDGGFDEVCPKPLTRADIYKLITRHFQYE